MVPTCDRCNGPMIQAVQVWAPVDAFSRRALHVFVCSKCRASPGQWKAIRSQTMEPLPSHEDEEEEEEQEEVSVPVQQRPAATVTSLMNVDDAALDALLAQNAQKGKAANNKKSKKKKKKKKKKPAARVPVWSGCEIRACWLEVVEKKTAAAAASAVSEKQAAEAAAQLERLEREGAKDKESWAGEQYESGSRESKTFRVFQKALARDPHRVLRYRRGAPPLWISDPTPEPPRCRRCGKRCLPELQLLPTLLYLGGAEQLWDEQLARPVELPDALPDADAPVVDEAAPEVSEEQVGAHASPAPELPELIVAPLPEFGACAVFCCPDPDCGGNVAEQTVLTQMPE